MKMWLLQIPIAGFLAINESLNVCIYCERMFTPKAVIFIIAQIQCAAKLVVERGYHQLVALFEMKNRNIRYSCT